MFQSLYNYFTGTRQRTWQPISQVPPGYFTGRSEYRLQHPGQYAAHEDTALTLSPFFAGVRLYQTSSSVMPLVVYQTGPNGSRDEARDHPAYPLLYSRPNPAQSRAVFMETLLFDYHLYGECFVHLQWAGNNRLLGMFPIRPYSVSKVEFGEDWKKTYHVTGFDDPLGDDEVLHVINFSRDGGLRGVSFLRWAAESLGLHKQVQQTASSLYANMPRVSGSVKQTGAMNKEAREELRQSLDEKFAGSLNAGGVLFLPLGTEFNPIDTRTAQDAQIVEALHASVQDIARWFGVSPMQLGDLSAGSGVYVTSASDKLAFYTRALLPVLEKFELEFNHRLFGSGSDTYCEFDTSNILRLDPEAQARVWSQGIADGYYTPEEVRSWLSLPVLPQDDAQEQPEEQTAQEPAQTDDVSQEAPQAQQQQEGEAELGTSNDLRATVGGSVAIADLQRSYYKGEIPRAAAVNNARLIFGFSSAEAESLFPVEEPKALVEEVPSEQVTQSNQQV